MDKSNRMYLTDKKYKTISMILKILRKKQRNGASTIKNIHANYDMRKVIETLEDIKSSRIYFKENEELLNSLRNEYYLELKLKWDKI